MPRAAAHHGHHSRAFRAAPAGIQPGWSLLRASLVQRLAGSALLLAVLWLLVAWALQS